MIFFGEETVLYVFMLLTANIVAETYRSGAIKNIIGRGIAKEQYYFSIAFTVSAVYLLVMLAGSVVMAILVGSKFGMGGLPYPAYYALAVIARILFAIAHISFALTMTIYTRNAITGTVFGFVIPNIPKAAPHNCVCGLRPIFCPIRAVIKGGNTYSIPALL